MSDYPEIAARFARDTAAHRMTVLHEQGRATWRPVPGYENYEVSDQGAVRSRRRKGSAGGVLTPKVGKTGYHWLHLYNDGQRVSRTVHQIVAAAFLGPRPDGQEVRHLDGVASNCALSNLAYGTRAENDLDKVRHGTAAPNSSKTHCPEGHPYDEVNTYRNPKGRRTCRPCRRETQRRWRSRNSGIRSTAKQVAA
ncbi:NUMOD4 motif-containing HNH endonuclease [Streptomyces sp. ISBFB 2968]|uniref:NUMOD4 motif-containing HNH endonuclease n=1 Tax=Streptomyces sp. ISBFB 2968 TaxID=2903527 RepID=UPI002FDC3C65